MSDAFERTQLLLGKEHFEKLSAAHITVLGLGAVGYAAAEGLVRSGLGNIRIMDFDEVKESNLNRQNLMKGHQKQSCTLAISFSAFSSLLLL